MYKECDSLPKSHIPQIIIIVHSLVNVFRFFFFFAVNILYNINNHI